MKTEIAEAFNTFFTNIVSNLKIPPYQDTDFARWINPVVEDDPIILYWKNTKPFKYHRNKKF